MLLDFSDKSKVLCIKKADPRFKVCFFIRFITYKQKKSTENLICEFLFKSGGDTRIRTGDQSFADSCLTTWLYRQIIYCIIKNKFYYTSVIKLWSGKRGSNPRPLPWQGSALSTELFPHQHGYDIKIYISCQYFFKTYCLFFLLMKKLNKIYIFFKYNA